MKRLLVVRARWQQRCQQRHQGQGAQTPCSGRTIRQAVAG